MRSVVAKRSIVIGKHKTSVSLEDQFWAGLKSIAVEKRVTLSTLISGIDHERQHGNLSSALRLYVLGWYRGGAAVQQQPLETQPVSLAERRVA